MTAYTLVLALHNIFRWLVLLAGLVAAGAALYGWLAGRNWTKNDDRFGLIFTISVDLQVLLGLILYFFLSPITRDAFRDFGAAMADTNLRFWSVEHVALMAVVLILVHLGRILSRRAATDTGKHRLAAIFYALTVVLVIFGIPWIRPLLPGL